MKRNRRRYGELFLLKVFIPGMILLFLSGCAGSKSEQKPSPAPAEEKKIEQPQKEEAAPSQPLPEPPSKPAPSPPPPSVSEPPKVAPSPSPPSPQPPAPLRVITILWTSVNLREGPGLNYKVVGTVKKGTVLTVLEEKGTWFKVLLEDGGEAWVSKAATSAASKPVPARPSKPKPM